MLASIIVFVVIARTLGVSEYGQFAAIFALVLMLVPFANLGAGHLLMRDISHGVDPQRALSCALRRVTAGGTLALLAILVVGHLLLPAVDWRVTALIAVAEFFASSTIEIRALRAFAQNEVRNAAVVRTVAALGKIGAATLALTFSQFFSIDLLIWAQIYTSCCLLVVIIAVNRDLRSVASPGPKVSARELFTGLPFSLNMGASYIQDDADKVILLREAGPEVAGLYAAAYRLLNLAYIPLRAGLSISYPRMLQASSNSNASVWTLLRRVIVLTTSYGLLAALAVAVVSPVLPQLLGDQYEESVGMLIALCWLPIAKAIELPIADSLTSTGHQWSRVSGQGFGAVTNIALNIFLIPTFSWTGAIWATAISQFVTITLLMWLAARARRRDA